MKLITEKVKEVKKSCRGSESLCVLDEVVGKIGNSENQ